MARRSNKKTSTANKPDVSSLAEDCPNGFLLLPTRKHRAYIYPEKSNPEQKQSTWRIALEENRYWLKIFPQTYPTSNAAIAAVKKMGFGGYISCGPKARSTWKGRYRDFGAVKNWKIIYRRNAAVSPAPAAQY